MAKIEDFTGAVDINADITPVTRKKIQTVSLDKWPEMSIGMLLQQRLVLIERVTMSLQSGHAEIAKQVQLGITSLDQLIQYKMAQEEENPNAEAGFIR